ncbi:phosphoinositide phospholipase C 2-like [Cynara cardunculus var. scolymus]|uniref:phosphoinositide phospholipase C 2-like n=1 Tax=Cynara cardunculus var. scolymus TaxID=59895 RepID=UPI000D628C94|nr:phosphoinositide phospholipase C 2-like [Cynara cardunculus var. scolymus]
MIHSPMSKQTYRVCFCFQRRFRIPPAEPPNGIKTLFNQYSENNLMDANHLQRFLVEVQKQDKATIADAETIITQNTPFIFHRKGFNLEAFFRYLVSATNSVLSPSHSASQDMTAPLSHYFIYTGHNSYLTGNQLSSDCSDVPIIQALERGVRVIELDIWPNSTKDDVLVLHGRTLTTPVELRTCLMSIKNHAFSASEYPVVVTLEDHLTTDLQAKVAEMIHQIFEDMLFTPDKDCLEEFPSPESLRKRVMISTKPPKEYLKGEKSAKKGNGSQEKDSSVEAWGGEIPSSADVYLIDDSDDSDDDDDEDLQADNVASEYKSLIAIHAGKGKGGLDDWLKVDPDKVRRLSLSEHELEKAAKTHGPQIVRFTQRNILRVYPKGTRFNSSNYNPLVGWMHGAQMVAFNMQGYGRSLWLMQGMFRANGGCGYVKKPQLLLKGGDEIFDPRIQLPVTMTLKITLYMGEGWYYDFEHTHFDAYSPPDFYARIGIAGVLADSVIKKTKMVEDSWNPAWNEEFEFCITVPELALLRIEVHEYDMSEKDDFAGQTCLPVKELSKGIRSVPLYSQKGDIYPSVKLLMSLNTL